MSRGFFKHKTIAVVKYGGPPIKPGWPTWCSYVVVPYGCAQKMIKCVDCGELTSQIRGGGQIRCAGCRILKTKFRGHYKRKQREFINCIDCGIEFVSNSSVQKRCAGCSKHHRSQWNISPEMARYYHHKYWLSIRNDPVRHAKYKDERKRYYRIKSQDPEWRRRFIEWQLRRRLERFATEPEFVERERRVRRDGALRQSILRRLRDDPARVEKEVYKLLGIGEGS